MIWWHIIGIWLFDFTLSLRTVHCRSRVCLSVRGTKVCSKSLFEIWIPRKPYEISEVCFHLPIKSSITLSPALSNPSIDGSNICKSKFQTISDRDDCIQASTCPSYPKIQVYQSINHRILQKRFVPSTAEDGHCAATIGTAETMYADEAPSAGDKNLSAENHTKQNVTVADKEKRDFVASTDNLGIFNYLTIFYF